ncbi:DUF262 domain-containing protein [Asanoa sp. NPDC049573]|uniref:DUF262 domain-containing protein n=1 Tax=Asanoa sp. NPDC049573 TaxID=3155396 RepID=UPI0034260934
MPETRSTTTKDVALLLQLEESKQLTVAPEYQRTAVWPRPAKAYLVDTILKNRPIPLLFFGRTINAQTGRTSYEVIDGQQRLRAVFDFIKNKFSLTESDLDSPWYGKKWRDLSDDSRSRLLGYDFVIEELGGYNDEDIRDMFRRMNRYVVKLNAQEQRHAVNVGKFKDFCEEVGGWEFWTANRTFSLQAQRRRLADEFAAELAILLLEGPQDKKKTVELYFGQYKDEFEYADDLRERLLEYTSFISKALPSLGAMQLRSRANVYALIGALDEVSDQGEHLEDLSVETTRTTLEAFDQQLQEEQPDRTAARYLRAASRQTDNVQPRKTRIQILVKLLLQGM